MQVDLLKVPQKEKKAIGVELNVCCVVLFLSSSPGCRPLKGSKVSCEGSSFTSAADERGAERGGALSFAKRVWEYGGCVCVGGGALQSADVDSYIYLGRISKAPLPPPPRKCLKESVCVRLKEREKCNQPSAIDCPFVCVCAPTLCITLLW